MLNGTTDLKNEVDRMNPGEDDLKDLFFISNVTFRTKFLNAVGDDKYLLKKFEEAVNYFKTYNYAEARTFLWKMKFTPNEVLGELGFSNNEDDYDNEYISPDLTKAFYHELRYQYTLEHEGFLKVDEIPACKEQFEALRKAVEDDPVVFFTISYICRKNCLKTKSVYEAVELIATGDSKNIYNGLRMICFPSKTANFSIPYATEIADLIKALNQNFYKEHHITQDAVDRLGNLINEYEASLARDRIEQESAENFDAYVLDEPTFTENGGSKGQVIEDYSGFNALETIFRYPSLVKDFMRLYGNLKSKNIDGQWIIKNFQVIRSIFKSVDNIIN